MTDIDFYELNSGRFNADTMLGQIGLKAQQNQKTVLLLTNSEAQSQYIEKSLWNFSDTHFVPHHVAPEHHPLDVIHINHVSEPNNHDFDILLNLNHEIPSHFGQFNRVIELVHETNKDTAREHFKFYKDRGYAIKHHKV